MSDQEFAPQTAQAETPESAPVNETPSSEATPEIAVSQESAPEEEKVAKHIEELKTQRRKRQEAEREAAYWRGQAEARGAEYQKPQQPVIQQAPVEPVMPVLDQFETYDEYERAMDSYRDQRTDFRLQRMIQEQRQREVQATVQQKFQTKLAEAAKADPTITDIATDPTLPVSEAMAPLIQQSDVAPELLKWLDNNRKDAQRLASLPPILAAKELGALEVRLQNTPKPSPPPKVSMAPEPIKTVNAIGNTEVNENELTIDAWMARRNEQQYKRRS